MELTGNYGEKYNFFLLKNLYFTSIKKKSRTYWPTLVIFEIIYTHICGCISFEIKLSVLLYFVFSETVERGEFDTVEISRQRCTSVCHKTKMHREVSFQTILCIVISFLKENSFLISKICNTCIFGWAVIAIMYLY